jgi:tRNA pseudouridine32 synthase/23S rRNA pseudouridine746 synthase
VERDLPLAGGAVAPVTPAEIATVGSRPDYIHQFLGYAPPPDTGLPLVFEDEHLLVLNKPGGLLSVPGRGEQMHDCLAHRVQARCPEAQIVHRLDMDTSGLIVMAKGPDMQKALSLLFALRQVHKRYVAEVSGLIEPDEGEVNLPLITDWPLRPRQKICIETGKPSLTRFRVLSRDEASQTTRVELEPITGRTHQLRVHMMALGHPIVNDPLYGLNADPDRPRRMRLHAWQLHLPHPARGEPMVWEAQPDSWG